MGSSPDEAQPSRSERAVAERSAEEFNYYIQNYRGPEAQFFEQLRTTEGERQSVAGQVTGDVETELAGLSKATTNAQLASGAKAGSGRSIFNQADISSIRGEGRGDAVSRGVQAADDQEVRGLIKTAAFGRGLAESSLQGTADQAERATRLGITRARAKAETQIALQQGAGAVAGSLFAAEGSLLDQIRKIKKPAATTGTSTAETPSFSTF